MAVAQDNLLRSLDDGLIDRQYLIGNAQQSIERGLDGVAPVDSNITMQTPPRKS